MQLVNLANFIQYEVVDELFNLIYATSADDKQKQENLEKIKFILEISEKSKNLGIQSMEVDFTKVKRFDHKFGNTLTEERHTLLAAAIEAGKIEIIPLLLKAKMIIDDTGSSTVSSLSHAARSNNMAIATLLLENGADINLHDPKRINANALFVACRYNAYEVAKLLLLNNINMTLTNSDNKLAVNYADEKIKTLLKAANYFKTAIEKLRPENPNILEAGSALGLAIKHNSDFVLSYLAKTANLRSQNFEHDEAYYHPHLLRLAIKNFKTYINTFPEFNEIYFPQGFNELIIELNAYDVESPNFATSEKIFKSIDEKNKTIKWFEKGTQIAKTKEQMKESIYYKDNDTQKVSKNIIEDKVNENKQEIETKNTESSQNISSLIVLNKSPIFVLAPDSDEPIDDITNEEINKKNISM